MTGPNFLGNLARRDGLAWLVAALARVRPPLLSSQISRPISASSPPPCPSRYFGPSFPITCLIDGGCWLGSWGSRRLRQVYGREKRNHGVFRTGSSDCACKPTCSLVPVSISIHSLPFQEQFQEQVPSLAPTPARIALVGSGECRPRCEGAVAAMTTLPSPKTLFYQISLFLSM